MEQLRLARVGTTRAGPEIHPAKGSLVFRGDAADGVEYACGGCGAAIARSIRKGQVRDLVIRCGRCNVRVGFEPVGPDEPIPPAACLVCSRDEPSLNGFIVLSGRSIIVVGWESAARYSLQTGTRYRWKLFPGRKPDFEPDPYTGLPIIASVRPLVDPSVSAQTFVETEAIIRAAVGPSFDEILRARGLGTGTVHRAVEEVFAIRAAAAASTRGSISFDHRRVVQALCDAKLLDRWRRHPGFSAATGNLTSADEYRSGIATLAIASFLADRGNGVSLQHPNPHSGRFADLLLRTDPTYTYGLEVKAPRVLDYPASLPTEDSIRSSLASQLARALGGRGRGQLAPNRPGVLAIVGFDLDAPTTALAQKVSAELILKRPASDSVVAAFVTNVVAAVRRRRFKSGVWDLGPGRRVESQFVTRTIVNPALGERFHIIFDPPQGESLRHRIRRAFGLGQPNDR